MKRLQRVYIESQSFEALIPKWDRKGAVFYCDPPYYMLTEMSGAGDARQASGYTEVHRRKVRPFLRRPSEGKGSLSL